MRDVGCQRVLLVSFSTTLSRLVDKSASERLFLCDVL